MFAQSKPCCFSSFSSAASSLESVQLSEEEVVETDVMVCGARRPGKRLHLQFARYKDYWGGRRIRFWFLWFCRSAGASGSASSVLPLAIRRKTEEMQLVPRSVSAGDNSISEWKCAAKIHNFSSIDRKQPALPLHMFLLWGGGQTVIRISEARDLKWARRFSSHFVFLVLVRWYCRLASQRQSRSCQEKRLSVQQFNQFVADYSKYREKIVLDSRTALC